MGVCSSAKCICPTGFIESVDNRKCVGKMLVANCTISNNCEGSKNFCIITYSTCNFKLLLNEINVN